MNTRQQGLLDKLNRAGRINTDEEAKAFKVSFMTIIRDLRLFESLRLATRVHGGAIPKSIAQAQVVVDVQTTDIQRLIGRKTLELIPDGSTILLSGGSTTLEVARQLAVSGKKISAVTYDLPIAITLFRSSVQVVVSGGVLREISLDLVGPVAEKIIDEYYIDIFISGCDGAIATEGFFTKDINLAEIQKKAVKKAKDVIIVTSSVKFQAPSFVKFASIQDISKIVTDKKFPAAYADKLRAKGVKVFLT
jgi:DeoR/GlpR family transcriptional regulator of sugar metabolism